MSPRGLVSPPSYGHLPKNDAASRFLLLHPWPPPKTFQSSLQTNAKHFNFRTKPRLLGVTTTQTLKAKKILRVAENKF
jgi:hypothetical protein